MKEKNDKNMAIRTSLITIILNVVLMIIKLIAGILGKSNAMISDAIHTGSDVFTTIIVIIGIKISNKNADKKHPYGHDRLECVISILLAFILLLTGFFIGFNGVNSIYNKKVLALPGIIALIAAVLSIVVKEFMYHFTKRVAKKVNSTSMLADAWHHRSDALSSIGAFIGIFASRLGYPIFDSIASIIICICIIKVAIDIMKDAVSKLIDKACDEKTNQLIYDKILEVNGVQDIDDVKTRLFGSKIYVDIEIAVDGKLSLTKAHKIASNVHDKIESDVPVVKHCMVHVNPLIDKKK